MVVNAMLHRWQTNGRSPVCVSRWRSRSLGRRNDLSQYGHGCGFTWSCVIACRRRLLALVKPRSHCAHANGRSPECTARWRLRSDGLAKLLAHAWHG